MKSGYFKINTGSKVSLDHSTKGADGQWRPTEKDDYRSDPGKTTKLVDEDGNEANPTHRYQEPAWKRKEREMTERARDYYGKGSNESALEQELWKQIGGTYQGEFNANVERGLWQANLRNDRDKVNKLSAELFDQVARASRQTLSVRR